MRLPVWSFALPGPGMPTVRASPGRSARSPGPRGRPIGEAIGRPLDPSIGTARYLSTVLGSALAVHAQRRLRDGEQPLDRDRSVAPGAVSVPAGVHPGDCRLDVV